MLSTLILAALLAQPPQSTLPELPKSTLPVDANTLPAYVPTPKILPCYPVAESPPAAVVSSPIRSRTALPFAPRGFRYVQRCTSSGCSYFLVPSR